MAEERFEGQVSFVQYEKGFLTIDYVTGNGKKKSVNGIVKEATQQKWVEEKLVTGLHYFREGDVVTFDLVLSVRGDKMTADRIVFLYNNLLNDLLNKARTDNEFAGYLKQVGDDFFIKEIGSYQFFKIRLSPWELPPPEATINDPKYFKLENLGNPEKLVAVLLDRKFIPGYSKAVKLFEEKKELAAEVVKVTPHGIYLNLPDIRMQAKIPLKTGEASEDRIGDTFNVLITHLSADKFVVKKSGNPEPEKK
ncbi:MAG: hypothetical protein EOO09_04180 [Chitinophagaceae bacterium]|nr:MAG: hypothetical protein EOO09_04180 [Chitinophagaceae bacterium]